MKTETVVILVLLFIVQVFAMHIFLAFFVSGIFKGLVPVYLSVTGCFVIDVVVFAISYLIRK